VCVCVCVCACVCRYPQRPEEDIKFVRADIVSIQCTCSEPILGPQEEQQAIWTTEPSIHLSPLIIVTAWVCVCLCVCVCVCVCACVCRYPQRPEEDIKFVWADIVSIQCTCSEPILGPQDEQQAIWTTEPSIHLSPFIIITVIECVCVCVCACVCR